MEQTIHAPGQLRRILPGVLLAAGLVWLMTGLFAPLTLGLLLAALMAPMAEALSRHTGCPRRLAAVGTMALFYLLLGLALTAAGSWAAGQGAQLLRQLPRLWNSSLLPALELLLPRLEELSARYAPVTAPLVDWAAAALERSLPGLLSGLSSRAASLTARWLSRLPALLLGSVFTVILSFCVAADYPRLCTLLRDKVPPGLTALLGELRYFGSRVLLRRSKKGRVYYGCEKNPACDFMTWNEPTAEKCPQCGSTLFKKGGRSGLLVCEKEGCGYSRSAAEKKE